MTPVDIDKLKELLARFGRAAEPYESFDGQHDFDEDYVVIDALGDRKVTVGDLREARAMKHTLAALIAKAERVDAMEAALTEAAATFDQFAAALREHEPVAMAQEIAVAELAASEARNALSPKESENAPDRSYDPYPEEGRCPACGEYVRDRTKCCATLKDTPAS